MNLRKIINMIVCLQIIFHASLQAAAMRNPLHDEFQRVSVDIPRVCQILNDGANPNEEIGGKLPIVMAAERRHELLLLALVYYGARVPLQWYKGNFQGLSAGAQQFLKPIHRIGAQRNALGVQHSHQETASDYFLTLFQAFLPNDGEFRGECDPEAGELHRAVLSGNLMKVLTFIENDSKELNRWDSNCMTPLSYALQIGDNNMVRLLLACGVNPSRQSGYGYRPIDTANRYSPEHVQLLLDYGAQGNLGRDRGLYKCQHYVEKESINDILKCRHPLRYLVSCCGLNLKRQDETTGKTILHRAVERGSINLAIKLMCCDPGLIGIRDCEGKTIIDYLLDQVIGETSGEGRSEALQRLAKVMRNNPTKLSIYVGQGGQRKPLRAWIMETIENERQIKVQFRSNVLAARRFNQLNMMLEALHSDLDHAALVEGAELSIFSKEWTNENIKRAENILNALVGVTFSEEVHEKLLSLADIVVSYPIKLPAHVGRGKQRKLLHPMILESIKREQKGYEDYERCRIAENNVEFLEQMLRALDRSGLLARKYSVNLSAGAHEGGAAAVDDTIVDGTFNELRAQQVLELAQTDNSSLYRTDSAGRTVLDYLCESSYERTRGYAPLAIRSLASFLQENPASCPLFLDRERGVTLYDWVVQRMVQGDRYMRKVIGILHKRYRELVSDGRYLRVALRVAVEQNDLPMLKEVVKRDININQSLQQSCYLQERLPASIDSRESDTPLLRAARLGYTELMEFLLDSGAEIDCVSSDGNTPLLCYLKSHPEQLQRRVRNWFEDYCRLTKRLLGDPETFDQTRVNGEGETLFHCVADNGHFNEEQVIEIFKFLVNTIGGISNVSTINSVTRNGYSVLHIAMQRNMPQFALYLIDDLDADIHTVDFNLARGGLLHWASRYNYNQIVDRLIQRGASLNLQTTRGRQGRRDATALHLAARNGHVGIIKALVAAGAHPALPDDQGRTPQTVARGRDHAEIADFLAHVVSTEAGNIAYSQLVGLNEEERAAYTRIIRYLKNPEEVEFPERLRSTILIGPEGCGKTVIPHMIRNEVGREECLDIKQCDGNTTTEMIKAALDKAAQNSPCMILFDKVDELADKVSRYLSLAVERHDGQFFIFATAQNSLQSNDPLQFLYRKFKFNVIRESYSAQQRRQMFEMNFRCLRRYFFEEEVLDRLAQRSLCFSAKEIVNLVRQVEGNQDVEVGDRRLSEVFVARVEGLNRSRGATPFTVHCTLLNDEISVEPISFDDLVGLELEKGTFVFAQEKLLEGNVFELSPLLLFGPPGNGKSSLFEAFEQQADVNVFRVEVSDLMDDNPYIVQEKLQALFKEVKQNSPCMLFLDEVDLLSEEKVSRFFETELKRLRKLNRSGDSEVRVFVAGATNNLQSMPRHLADRFGDPLFVENPNQELRQAILRHYLDKSGALDDVLASGYLASLTERSEGFSARHLSDIVDSARSNALRIGGNLISREALDRAFRNMHERILYEREHTTS